MKKVFMLRQVMVPSKENSTVWKGLTPSMKKPFKAGSNFKKISREELYDRH